MSSDSEGEDEGQRRPEMEEDRRPGTGPESPLHRLRQHKSYWVQTMHQIGFICAMTLSILDAGYRLEWDSQLGPAPAAFLRNHPSAYTESAFVSDAVAAGVAAGIMVACDRSALTCVLPLGVAFNRKGKRRLIWDGRHVNRHLRKEKFKMESLQREGRTLFEDCSFGGTADLSSAYHHVDMHESAHTYLGFEWEGEHRARSNFKIRIFCEKFIFFAPGPRGRRAPPARPCVDRS